MRDYSKETSNDGISLANLPPDIIRTIIPMVPSLQKTRLIAKAWNTTAREHLKKFHLDYVEINTILNGQVVINVTLPKDALVISGISKWKIVGIDRKTNFIKVESAPQDQKQLMNSGRLNTLFEGYARINTLCINEVFANFAYYIISCLKTVVIENLKIGLMPKTSESERVIVNKLAEKLEHVKYLQNL
ncbi:hypothetical protein PRIPAC_93687 [Pristionchus pacificus]|uniref:Uncharacterized protein n=1 Tax=Pristionchus pacificus TaxID=54126 RepID=A0A2A6CHI1_PRIPA|nr:hypothetical protein PRIPAC_93687 [Pristionchus pacificus]|eukprot:PDM77685.1 hypothetical protein PRIPAC_34552 [Pristionchus pacificus]